LTEQGFPAFCSRIALGIRKDLSTAWRGYFAGGDFSLPEAFAPLTALRLAVLFGALALVFLVAIVVPSFCERYRV
jgi:hypothetical protein